jgi:hypothetical protein
MNVATAKLRRWSAILVEGIDQARAALVDAGVLKKEAA